MKFTAQTTLSLVAALAFIASSACTETNSGSPPPAGMAGVATKQNAAQPVAAPTPPPAQAAASSQPAGIGAGVNPHASASQPSARGAPPPGHPPMGTSQGAASQAARPTVVKGPGQDNNTAQVSKQIVGKVAETFNSAGYTYLRVQTANAGDVWAAVMETSVAVGATVSMTESLTMHDFHAKSLNRTFDKIVFATLNSK